jgi:purine-binding chemotaxis protein CheW
MKRAEIVTEDVTQYLSFFIGAEEYGVALLESREIVPYGEITRVPSMPRAVRGIIHLRGGVVPVIDLAVLFGQPERPVTRRTCVVVVSGALQPGTESRVGLVVDDVHQLLALRPDEIEPTVAFGPGSRPRYINGTARAGDRFVLLLELAGVFAQVDLEELTP